MLHKNIIISACGSIENTETETGANNVLASPIFNAGISCCIQFFYKIAINILLCFITFLSSRSTYNQPPLLTAFHQLQILHDRSFCFFLWAIHIDYRRPARSDDCLKPGFTTLFRKCTMITVINSCVGTGAVKLKDLRYVNGKIFLDRLVQRKVQFCIHTVIAVTSALMLTSLFTALRFFIVLNCALRVH